jgi:hypothetical protein
LFSALKPEKVLKIYTGESIALATLHQKERVIAPLFRHHLGAQVVVSTVDTDSLGTFSGEIERKGQPKQVAIAKARLGMSALGLSRGIATEGSFGPHPEIPFLSIHHELIVFIDTERRIEVVEQQLFPQSIYDSIEVASIVEAEEFLVKNRIGSYGMIVQALSSSIVPPEKGITARLQLEKAIEYIKQRSGDDRVRILTDMRAHCNPLRMWRIRALARALVHRLTQCCPECAAPGWGVTGSKSGLPCQHCGAATAATHYRISSCSVCGFKQQLSRLDGKKVASVAECSFCNP